MEINYILHQYWEQLCKKSESLPNIEEIIPDDIMEIWKNCFILQINTSSNQIKYSYKYLGDKIIRAYKEDLDSEYDSPPIISEDPETLAELFEEIIYNQNPIIEDNKILYSDRGIIKYSQCILPLKPNGDIYTMIGAMKHRMLNKI